MKITAIFLAAGKSRRFGIKDKLFMDVHGTPLCFYALSTILKVSLDAVCVIARKEQRHMFVPFLHRVQIISPLEDCGQAASLKTGILHAEQAGADAAIIVLADQPFITKEAIEKLLSSFKENPHIPFAVYRRQNIIAPPILINRSLFADIRLLKGDKGAKDIIRTCESKGIILQTENSDLFFDVDTLNDYEALIRMKYEGVRQLKNSCSEK